MAAGSFFYESSSSSYTSYADYDKYYDYNDYGDYSSSYYYWDKPDDTVPPQSSSSAEYDYKSEFKSKTTNQDKKKRKSFDARSTDSGFSGTYSDDEEYDYFDSQSPNSKFYTNYDGYTYYDYVQTSKSYTKDQIQNLINTLVDDPTWWKYFTNPPSNDNHNDNPGGFTDSSSSYGDESDDFDYCSSSGSTMDDNDINCYVDDIHVIKTNKEYNITNDSSEYVCTSEKIFINVLKKLTEEQQQQKQQPKVDDLYEDEEFDELEQTINIDDDIYDNYLNTEFFASYEKLNRSF
jgi:hypothetical protein